MHPSVSQYARSLEELTEDASAAKVSEVAKNFFAYLKRRGEGKKIGAILKHLEKSEAEKKGRVAVTVTLAHEVERETKHTLLSRAEKLFPHKKVELQYVINKNIIGGAVFRTDETLYDASISNELNVLKKSLLKA